MAEDYIIIKKSSITEIANAIRNKRGDASTTKYSLQAMPTKISSISSQSKLGTKTITVSTPSTTGVAYSATDDALDGYSKVTVKTSGLMNTPASASQITISSLAKTDVVNYAWAQVDSTKLMLIPSASYPEVIRSTRTDIDVTNYAKISFEVPPAIAGGNFATSTHIIATSETSTIEIDTGLQNVKGFIYMETTNATNKGIKRTYGAIKTDIVNLIKYCGATVSVTAAPTGGSITQVAVDSMEQYVKIQNGKVILNAYSSYPFIKDHVITWIAWE